jgi:hypothetical protein
LDERSGLAGAFFLIYKIVQNIDIDNAILLKYNIFQKTLD